MDEFESNNADAGQVSDTGRERGRYGLSNWSGSGVTGVSRAVGMSLVERKIQARRTGGSALGRSLSTPHAPSQYPSSTYLAAWRPDEKPPNNLAVTTTKPRFAGPRPVMITLPSSPSPQNTPNSARRRSSSLGNASPAANTPRLSPSETVTSPVENPVSRSATATPPFDLGSEADHDEQSLMSELSDLSDDPDFKRRVEERGQKRVLLRDLTTREENGDDLNEEEQALLTELRRAQEIENAAWSGGAHGLFEMEKIETTHWERYKERLRAAAVAAEEENPRGDNEEGQDDVDAQDGADPLNDNGPEFESEMEQRPQYEELSAPKLKHRDSLDLRQRLTSVSADVYSRPSRSHNITFSAHKSRPVSSTQYPVASSNRMDDRPDGAEVDRARERGRLSIKNEEEEEEYYQRAVASLSTARPPSRVGRDAGPSIAGGSGVGGTLAAGMVAKVRDRRLGKPAGSGEYPMSELDDRKEREKVLRLQREHSMKEREARRAKVAVIAGGSGTSPSGVSNPAIPVRTPHARQQSHSGATSAGRGTTFATAEAERTQLASSTGRTLRGTGTKRARSPSTGPREVVVEKVPATTKYGGALPPPNPRTQPRARRDQQHNPRSQHGVYVHDFAQQQHQSQYQYQQYPYSQPIYPTADPNIAIQPQYAPNGTLLSRSTTAPAQVMVNGHAQHLLPQASQIIHPSAPGNSSTTSSTGDNSSGSIVTVGKMSYTKLELIGKGGSSRVYRVLRTTDRTTWALKRVTLDKSDHDTMKGYMNEIQLLKRLDGNPNIIQLIEHDLRHAQHSQEGTLLMVMELGEVDFSRLLQERAGLPISPPWIVVYWKQMLDAVRVIHDEKIVHSDLKPANFVLVKGRLKLIDFGIANAIANDTTNIQRDNQIGTVNYMSPEAIEAPIGMSRLKIGRPSDVWSLGCIFYQMVYGAPPFQAYNMHQKMRIIPDGSWKIHYPDVSVPIIPAHKTDSGESEKDEGNSVTVPACFIVTMQRCLERDPKKRATIPELLAEEWVNTVPATQAPRRNLVLKGDEAILNKHYLVQALHYFADLYHKRVIPTSIPFRDDEAYRALLDEAADDIIPPLKAITDPENNADAYQ